MADPSLSATSELRCDWTGRSPGSKVLIGNCIRPQDPIILFEGIFQHSESQRRVDTTVLLNNQSFVFKTIIPLLHGLFSIQREQDLFESPFRTRFGNAPISSISPQFRRIGSQEVKFICIYLDTLVSIPISLEFSAVSSVFCYMS